jgi:MarR family transcriptional regulator, organic hydroperoxide resistance regulator
MSDPSSTEPGRGAETTPDADPARPGPVPAAPDAVPSDGVATDFQTAFWATKHALARASATAFARHGVHEGQQYVLRCLWQEDGLCPGEVAKRLNLATPTVTRTTTRMAAAGLLRREPDRRDRRMVRLWLTDRGRTLEKDIDAEISHIARRALGTFTDDAVAALVRALEEVRRNLEDR